LGQLCEAVDKVVALVEARLPGLAPAVRDWNDRLLIEAVARGWRCLRNVRQLACSGHSEDAYVLARSLVTLTLQYLWLARVDDEAEREDRLKRLQLKRLRERVKLRRELIDLGYLPVDRTEEDVSKIVDQFEAHAKKLEEEHVRQPPKERDMALKLDRGLASNEVPRFFELIYARIYRPTSQVVHYGLGAAVRAVKTPSLGAPLSLEHANEDDAAEALGLALVTYGALLLMSEPIVKHGLSEDVEQVVKSAHAAP
jgi:hypothetical protein